MPCSRSPGGVPAPGEGDACSGGGVETPPVTATAAGGTHPTGMHSCFDAVFGKIVK